MRLVYIHGASAVGKLTVAKEVVGLVPAKLFDNHASIDLVRTVFDYDAPGFWSLVESVRILMLEASAKEGVPIVLMTSCYSDPHDRPTFEKHELVLEQYAAEMCPVFLHCSSEAMKRRVTNLDRKACGKISSVPGLERFLGQYNHVPVPHSQCIELSTEEVSAAETARKIVKHFGLEETQQTRN